MSGHAHVWRACPVGNQCTVCGITWLPDAPAPVAAQVDAAVERARAEREPLPTLVVSAEEFAAIEELIKNSPPAPQRLKDAMKRSNGTPPPMPAVQPPRELHGLVGAAVDAIREREANDLQQLRARFGETTAALEECQAGHAREVGRADAAEKRAQEAEQERDISRQIANRAISANDINAAKHIATERQLDELLELARDACGSTHSSAVAPLTQDREQQLAVRDAEIARLNAEIAGLREKYSYSTVYQELEQLRAQPRDGALRGAATELMRLDALEECGMAAWKRAIAAVRSALAAEPQAEPADNSRDIARTLAAAADAVQERKHVCAGMAMLSEQGAACDGKGAKFWHHMADELQRAENDLRARSLALRGGR